MDTKDKILDAAEQLFSEHGFASTSMREITNLADVNLASVNYHFGSKLDLLKAVFARRFGPVNQERLERLDALSEPDVESVLRAFFEPLFHRLEHEEGWGNFCQLVGRTHSDTNNEIRACLVEQIEVIVKRFAAAFATALPELPQPVLAARIHFAVGAMAHTFAFCRYDDIPLVSALPGSDTILEHLIDFSVAGLRAPVRSVMTMDEGTV